MTSKLCEKEIKKYNSFLFALIFVSYLHYFSANKTQMGFNRYSK